MSTVVARIAGNTPAMGRKFAMHMTKTLLSLSILALATAACSSQPDQETPQRPNAAAPTSPGATPTNPGVTPTEVKVGMNAVFSGPSTGLGVEMWRGATAAFQEANAKGGVHGRKISLVLSDDRYEADSAAPALVKLIAEHRVFNSGWSVGTPTIVKFLPVVLQHHKTDKFFHFGNFTGAQPQRNAPYAAAVFNVRASYRQETAAMVDAYVALGRKKIGVYVQDDAYGADGREGTIRALRKHGLELIAETRYPRGQKYEVSVAAQVTTLRDAGVDAVIMAGSYQACAAFVRDARLTGWDVPIHDLSFVGPDQLYEYLTEEEKKTGKRIVYNLINTEVVPHYDDTSLPMVKQYRAAIDRFAPQLPPEASNSGYEVHKKYTFGSLEGYITAQVYLRILDKVGPDLTREKFIAAAEGMGEFDLGVGAPASYSAQDHQALDRVWMTYADKDGWKAVDNLATVIRGDE